MAYENIKLKCETSRCLLCHEASCQKACPKGLKTADIIRSVRFENMTGVAKKIGDIDVCSGCSAPCMENCRRAKIDKCIDIKQVIADVRAK